MSVQPHNKHVSTWGGGGWGVVMVRMGLLHGRLLEPPTQTAIGRHSPCLFRGGVLSSRPSIENWRGKV